jgi:hypothetical protein
MQNVTDTLARASEMATTADETSWDTAGSVAMYAKAAELADSVGYSLLAGDYRACAQEALFGE